MLRGLGVPPGDIADSLARVHRAIAQTLADERGRWILAAHAEGQSEFALSGPVDNRVMHLKIDRTFVDEDGTRWVIDYKTGVSRRRCRSLSR